MEQNQAEIVAELNRLNRLRQAAVVVALVRGFSRHSGKAIGNIWTDLTRATLWVLLPLSFVFALILAYQLITDEFANQGVSFSFPWLQVGLIAGLAFGAALLMTLIPSRQASSIPIAEALRYE